MAATCYFMVGMVRGDHRNARLQQRMMRGRVMSQGFTVLAMCASGIWAGYRANQERLEKRRIAKEPEDTTTGGGTVVPS